MGASLPSPRILLGPGPSSVTDGVLDALRQAPIGYLDPELFTLLNRLRANLRQLFGTDNEFTIPLTGTGMAGMESCLANLIEPGDNVVVGVNGFFGGRMTEISRRLGANVTQVDGEWGKALEPDQFRKALQPLSTVKLVACVHAETSTGVCQPLGEIGVAAREKGALFLVDAVTSLGGIPVDMDRSGVDVCYSGTQKCVGAPPGLSPISVSERAWQVAASRKTPVLSWYYDWQLLRGYYDEPHSYHHTVPVNLLYALDHALIEIMEEGMPARFDRHRKVSLALVEGLAPLGSVPLASDDCRLPTLNAMRLPRGVTDEVAIRKRLLSEFGIEIGGGLGHLRGQLWRIGTMGASATHRNVTLLLAALKEILGQ